MFEFRMERTILAVLLLPASSILLSAWQEPKLSKDQIRAFLLNAKVNG